MEFWFIFLASITLAIFLKLLLNLLHPKPKPKLPPGPLTIPIFGTLQLLWKSFSDMEPILRSLHSVYGPMVSLKIGHRTTIFISTPELAYEALIHKGIAFADRPPAPATTKIISSNQHNINSAPYGPLWRLLRRNLSSELLHPSRVKSFAHARKWVLDILIQNLKSDSRSSSPKRTQSTRTGAIGFDEAECTGSKPVLVKEHFQYVIFCLAVFMCFGEKYDEFVVREIETVQRSLLLKFNRFNILNFFPKLGQVLFGKRWNEFYQLNKNLVSVLLPLIKARQEKKLNGKSNVTAYVDTLLNLTLPEEGGRKLTDQELVSLCSEFLTGGTDTTSTAFQWILAQLVNHLEIQSKLFNEVKGVAKEKGEITEEDLKKLPYLKAVVLEGLRRHPPGHFVFPHAVTQDIQLGKYVVPKDTTVNFTVAEIGWDPKVWEEPMEFRPERFSGEEEGFDITSSREIKMMSFGSGRRSCPGMGLALLHLEYFLANLIMQFEWTAENRGEVDLSEEQQMFTTVMKNPLKACIKQRVK